MIFQRILFSRTKTEDYRWLLKPKDISDSELNDLRSLFKLCMANREAVEKQKYPPIYFFRIVDHLFLLTFSMATYRDGHGRKIYNLNGIRTHSYNYRLLWAYIPYFLNDYRDKLDSWRFCPFEESDNIFEKESDDFSVDELNILIERYMSVELDANFNFDLNRNYSNTDFENIMKYMCSPLTPPFFFAFGSDSKVNDLLGPFQYSIKFMTTIECDASYDKCKTPSENECDAPSGNENKQTKLPKNDESLKVSRFNPVNQNSVENEAKKIEKPTLVESLAKNLIKYIK